MQPSPVPNFSEPDAGLLGMRFRSEAYPGACCALIAWSMGHVFILLFCPLG